MTYWLSTMDSGLSSLGWRPHHGSHVLFWEDTLLSDIASLLNTDQSENAGLHNVMVHCLKDLLNITVVIYFWLGSVIYIILVLLNLYSSTMQS